MTVMHVGIMHDVFIQALFALKENKLRTVLSILGIAIGISAVMVVGTVSLGVKSYVFAELKSYGLETLWVYRKRDQSNPYRNEREGTGIDNEDLKLFPDCCPAVKRISPVVYSFPPQKQMRAKGRFVRVNLEGVGVNYLAINRDSIFAGRGFRQDDMLRRLPVAIIGTKVRDKLFGQYTNPVGREFRWGEQRLTVIGVLDNKSRDLLTQLGADYYDANSRVLIPYTVYQQQLNSKDVGTIQAEAMALNVTKKALGEITHVLQRRHDNRYVYTTESMDAWIDTAHNILRNISLIGLLGASISLLVGGMGIMNIMTTSVVERTREIGIRKALGARRRDILFQFLMEATVVSVIGGALGLLLGSIVALVIGYAIGYPLGISWLTAIIALLVSISVGLMSGFYPAHRAAKLKPVDALRYE
jgi:putative ABC transport system permease protein